MVIRRKKEIEVKPGMFFNVAVHLKNLTNAKEKTYGLMLADTILVVNDSSKNLTKRLSSAYEDISYSL